MYNLLKVNIILMFKYKFIYLFSWNNEVYNFAV